LLSSYFSLQIYGPESSGKTTLALHAIAEVQVQYVFGLFYSSVWNFYRHGAALGREGAFDYLDEKEVICFYPQMKWKENNGQFGSLESKLRILPVSIGTLLL